MKVCCSSGSECSKYVDVTVELFIVIVLCNIGYSKMFLHHKQYTT
jgi:hypothetical protein